jgi:hypothetical protein
MEPVGITKALNTWGASKVRAAKAIHPHGELRWPFRDSARPARKNGYAIAAVNTVASISETHHKALTAPKRAIPAESAAQRAARKRAPP